MSKKQKRKEAKQKARAAAEEAAAAAAAPEDESESESDEDAPAAKRPREEEAPQPRKVRYVNKQRVLVVCSRGTSARLAIASSVIPCKEPASRISVSAASIMRL